MTDKPTKVTYLGLAPNFDKDGRHNYHGLPDPRNRTREQKQIAGRKGAASRCANQAKITLKEAPWES